MAEVLVVDDDDAVRGVVRSALEGAGHDVREAADGEAALGCVKERLPDLVVTNIYMPEKEGVSLVRELRLGHRALPIIAISGGGRSGNQEILEVARRFGANRTLAKPLDYEELISTVGSLLADAQASPTDGAQ